ncbi:hypothetical protein CRUP_038594 [Coryphaenoides rupestris]|nr:hypothetical protein CRUP_038594 [Coryphaenoides rupestris]
MRAPPRLSESSSYRSASPSCVDSDGEPDVDVETNNKSPEEEEEDSRGAPSSQLCPRVLPGPQSVPPHGLAPGGAVSKAASHGADLQRMGAHGVVSSEKDVQNKPENHVATSYAEVYTPERDEPQRNSPYHFRPAHYQRGLLTSNDEGSSKEEPSSTVEEVESKSFTDPNSEESDEGKEATARTQTLTQRDQETQAKEELQKQLLEQVELRKKLEREFQHLKDNFQDQMKRELSYREEMVQQLHIVRAHDALHHFSCKMLTPRHCAGTCSFKPPLLPP